LQFEFGGHRISTCCARDTSDHLQEQKVVPMFETRVSITDFQLDSGRNGRGGSELADEDMVLGQKCPTVR
jgi:hypothetical protein